MCDTRWVSDVEAAGAQGSHGYTGGPAPSLSDRPPGWLFHGVLAATLLFLLWASSSPGGLFFGWFYGLPFLWVLGLVWLARSVVYDRSRRKRIASGNPRALLFAPCLVVIAACLVFVNVPLRVRWTVSRPSFQQVVDTAAPAASDEGWHRIGGLQRLGLYDVTEVYKVRDAVIFYEASGGFIDDTGFACLPSGPFPELENGGFENPRFDHLDGCWYTWSASW